MTKQQMQILLVEDNKIDRMAIERHIEREMLSCQLITAASKETALQLLKNSAFDVVILDYQLQDGTAFDLLPHINDMPVIIVTGSGSEQVAAEAMRKGAYDYLIKDSESNYLALLPPTIASVLKRRQLEQEKDNLISQLQKALENVKQLSGLLPICASCKKIRDDKGYWNRIEGYIQAHTEAEFSHGICPECAKKLYPELYGDEQNHT